MPVSDAEYAHNCLFVKQNKESKKLQIRLRPWLQQDRYINENMKMNIGRFLPEWEELFAERNGKPLC